MDSQDPRFTTPPPRYNNLYDTEAPPSAQPRTPLDFSEFIKIPNSQLSTQSWGSRNGPRPEIPESQQTTQSWDSRDGPRPNASLRRTPSPPLPASLYSPLPGPPPFVPDSQEESSQGSNHSSYIRATETSRDKRNQIQTTLLFKIPHDEIRRTLDVTEHQINVARTKRLTPQKNKTGRHPKLHTPEKAQLIRWLETSPSHHRLPWKHVQHWLPGFGTKAVITAFYDLK